MFTFYCEEEKNNKNIAEINNIISFINFCYLYSDIINFIPGTHKNSFVEFLETDDIIIYSLIISTNDKKIKDFLLNNILYLKNAKNIILENDNLTSVFIFIYELLTLLKYWYTNLSIEDVIRNNIEEFSKQIIPEIEKLINAIDKLNINSENLNKIISKINKVLSEKLYLNIDTKIDINEKIFSEDKSTLYDFFYDIIRNTLESFIKKITELKIIAINNFLNVLYNKNHNPHITLLLTFFKELNNVNKSLLNLNSRIKNYYYKGILMYKNKPEKKMKPS